jgi:hypothetical protein
MAMVAIGKPETRVAQLCAELGITSQTLYRHVDPTGHCGLMGRRCWAAKQKTASIREEAMSDRNGGKPPLDEILDALKEIYLTLRHSSRSKRTLRQAGVLKRVFVMLEDCGIAVPSP